MPGLESVLIFLALLGVIFEDVIHVNKTKITLFFGTLGWVLLFLTGLFCFIFSSLADKVEILTLLTLAIPASCCLSGCSRRFMRCSHWSPFTTCCRRLRPTT